ncbi:MAG: methyltransferase domain-containing protein [Burkholderiales bacterium]
MHNLKTASQGAGYNERLFAGGLRGRLHWARFAWIRAELARYAAPVDSVLELGCFDGKLLDFLPNVPRRYVGLDANWEGGLDLARTRFHATPWTTFAETRTPADVAAALTPGQPFDVAVAMETLEHLPPTHLNDYLAILERHVDGYLFVSVPTEIGPVFLAKWVAKALLRGDPEPYTSAELLWTTIGASGRVERREHKGFDYRRLLDDLALRFDIVSVSGQPVRFVPPWLSFGVGIVARTKGSTRRRPPAA